MPLTDIVTERDCAVEMLVEAGVTVTVGVVLTGGVVLPPPPPPPQPAIHRLPAIPSQNAACRPKLFIRALSRPRREVDARYSHAGPQPPLSSVFVRKPSYHGLGWYRHHFLGRGRACGTRWQTAARLLAGGIAKPGLCWGFLFYSAQLCGAATYRRGREIDIRDWQIRAK